VDVILVPRYGVKRPVARGVMQLDELMDIFE
jgi:hypothetical protein